MPNDLAITGCTGRVGKRLIALADSADARVVAALARPGHPSIGRDAGEVAGVNPIGVPITADLPADATPDVLIDFTTPTAMRHWLAVARDRRVALLTGTTGLSPDDHATLDAASADIPVLHATNTSLGVAVLARVVAEVARQLGDGYDVEIVESHHRHKTDAPSGTALTLADAVLSARGLTRDALTPGRSGPGTQRKSAEVGIHSLRAGDEVGRHTVHFAAPGERLELTHAATSRDTFALGALRAAGWLAGRPPGQYAIADVLGTG